MPARSEVPVGAPVWNDLATRDLGSTVAFYTALFGWEHTDLGADVGHYGSFTLDGELVAGVGPVPDPSRAPGWAVYLRSADARATLERVRAAGGTVLWGPHDVPGQGVMAGVRDPSGAAVSVWEPRGHPGFAVVAEPGAPAWHELLSTGYRAAVAFYEEAFGWSVEVQGDSDEFRYCVDQVDGEQHAGIMDASAWLGDEPSHWSVYLLVEDTDEAVARAVELGGSVSMAPEDSPYGRMAVLADPQGSPFKVISAPDGAA
ncbi:VOC family protein [Cellulomonas sp. PhB143]|uniref:VOC family protein n=1 Tax=Cellulomonas sp. PhB143 TaxID=2485186 RepID=UPI000F482D89|nr:VOC family protein [Cellulomonas sp. PhB143]ROS75280.1 hypothetical protein EDF32_1688 [Cellulomonas sp. PhB143]